MSGSASVRERRTCARLSSRNSTAQRRGRCRDDGKTASIVVVDYRGKSDKLSVDVKGLCGVKAASALVLDNTCDLMPVPVDFRGGTICLPRSDENSAAYLVTLEL